jgi:hypothetical protein
MKAIPPGYGLCLMPKFIKYFPKYYSTDAFMQHIVSLAEDHLYGKKIPVKLVVRNSRSPVDPNMQLSYYAHIIPDGIDNAMAICYAMDEKSVAQYLEELSYNGINENNMYEFTQQWKNFSSNYAKITTDNSSTTSSSLSIVKSKL